MTMREERRQVVLSPPSSVVSWLAFVGLMMASVTGGFAYGRLETRVATLESYAPITVDRRLTLIEAKLEAVEYQLQRLVGRLYSEAPNHTFEGR